MSAATWNEGYAEESMPLRKHAGLALPVVLLIITFFMPPESCVNLGPLRLSPYRVVLLVFFVPSLLHILSGKAGGIIAADVAIFLHSVWCVIALGAYGGADQALQSGGIYLVEAFGAYAIGRRYIRSVEDMKAMALLLAVCVCVLLMFSLPESVTHQHFLREGFRAVLGGPGLPIIEPRMGLSRAFGSFEHPILYGVFCSMAFGTAWYLVKPDLGFFKGWLVIAGIILASFVSLSAGAWLMLAAQMGLAGWDRITRGMPGRWGALIFLFIMSLLVVSMLSNRSPVQAFISYASFSSTSSYNRVLIWQYGTAEVGRHPLFGIGLGEWIRAPWMSTSMDNFWLCTAVRYGMPALLLLAYGILFILFKAAAKKNVSEEWARCRMGWIATIVGTAIAACTVHLWNNTFGLYLFIIGAGAWLVDAPAASPDGDHDHSDDIYHHEGDAYGDLRYA